MMDFPIYAKHLKTILRELIYFKLSKKWLSFYKFSKMYINPNQTKGTKWKYLN